MAIATMVIPAVKSKVELAFIVSPKILRAWPNSVGEVAVHARVIYGAAE